MRGAAPAAVASDRGAKPQNSTMPWVEETPTSRVAGPATPQRPGPVPARIGAPCPMPAIVCASTTAFPSARRHGLAGLGRRDLLVLQPELELVEALGGRAEPMAAQAGQLMLELGDP